MAQRNLFNGIRSEKREKRCSSKVDPLVAPYPKCDLSVKKSQFPKVGPQSVAIFGGRDIN